MTFEEWWIEHQKEGGTFIDDYYHAKAAWEAGRKDLKDTILNRTGGRVSIDEQEWEDEDDI